MALVTVLPLAPTPVPAAATPPRAKMEIVPAQATAPIDAAIVLATRLMAIYVAPFEIWLGRLKLFGLVPTYRAQQYPFPTSGGSSQWKTPGDTQR
jgi:hypothetical protein